jgi:hypothetical protein
MRALVRTPLSRAVLLVALTFAVAGCDLLPWPGRALVTEEQAIAIAREAAPNRFREEEVLRVVRRNYRDVASEHDIVLSEEVPAPDQCVFSVNIGYDSPNNPQSGFGVIVILNCFTGEVITMHEWVA